MTWLVVGAATPDAVLQTWPSGPTGPHAPGAGVLLVPPGTAPGWLDALARARGAPTPPPPPIAHGFWPVRLGDDRWVVVQDEPERGLAQLHARFQAVWLDDAPAHALAQAPHSLRRLARLCTADAQLWWASPPPPSTQHVWADAGFVAPHPSACARYRPRWPVAPAPTGPERRQALVVGAGLAGAAVCHVLTQAGWAVTLLDAAAAPAQGASGLPVGLMTEHATAGETVMAELSRPAMALHAQALAQWVAPGHGWQPTEVVQRKGWNPADHPPGTPIPTVPGALVRPAALVQAWLDQAQATGRLQCRLSARVARLTPDGDGPQRQWTARDAQGLPLAAAAHVVVAAAYGSAELLAPHGAEAPDASGRPSLRAVKGQMTLGPVPHGLESRATPWTADTRPVRQNGVYVPHYHDASSPWGADVWAMGSTYERGVNDAQVTAQGHARNADSLAHMDAAAHQRLQAQAQTGQLRGWAQVRCASADRLPLVGALPAPTPHHSHRTLDDVPRVPGLWTVCAFGSRGLTLALLAAHTLAARMNGEPLPVPRAQAEAMDPARFWWKHGRLPR